MSAGLISVAQAGELRERYGYRALILVGVRVDGTVDVMSHAATSGDCRVIGDYAQGHFGKHLPVVPFQTWFGWGNGGRPLPLTAEQLDSLSPSEQRYALRYTRDPAA